MHNNILAKNSGGGLVVVEAKVRPSWLGMKESNKFLQEKEFKTLDKQLSNLHALKTPGHKTGFYIIRLEFKSKYPVPQEIKDIVEKYADSNNLVVVES